jgi:hypothetical protein
MKEARHTDGLDLGDGEDSVMVEVVQVEAER